MNAIVAGKYVSPTITTHDVRVAGNFTTVLVRPSNKTITDELKGDGE